MQTFTSSPGRNTQSEAKISVPPQKSPEQPNDQANDSPVKLGNGSVKGFAGGLINPKI